jgi:hypothetical protein
VGSTPTLSAIFSALVFRCPALTARISNPVDRFSSVRDWCSARKINRPASMDSSRLFISSRRGSSPPCRSRRRGCGGEPYQDRPVAPGWGRRGGSGRSARQGYASADHADLLVLGTVSAPDGDALMCVCRPELAPNPPETPGTTLRGWVKACCCVSGRKPCMRRVNRRVMLAMPHGLVLAGGTGFFQMEAIVRAEVSA